MIKACLSLRPGGSIVINSDMDNRRWQVEVGVKRKRGPDVGAELGDGPGDALGMDTKEWQVWQYGWAVTGWGWRAGWETLWAGVQARGWRTFTHGLGGVWLAGLLRQKAYEEAHTGGHTAPCPNVPNLVSGIDCPFRSPLM